MFKSNKKIFLKSQKKSRFLRVFVFFILIFHCSGLFIKTFSQLFPVRHHSFSRECSRLMKQDRGPSRQKWKARSGGNWRTVKMKRMAQILREFRWKPVVSGVSFVGWETDKVIPLFIKLRNPARTTRSHRDLCTGIDLNFVPRAHRRWRPWPRHVRWMMGLAGNVPTWAIFLFVCSFGRW